MKKTAQAREPFYPESSPLNIEFVRLVSSPIWYTWSQIAPDMQDATPAEALEAVLDADRIKYTGDCPDCAAYLQRMYRKYGFGKVRKTLLNHIQLGI